MRKHTRDSHSNCSALCSHNNNTSNSNHKFYRSESASHHPPTTVEGTQSEKRADDMSTTVKKPGSPDAAIDSKFLDKQSRTIGTYGLETMTKLISFKVLIVGCSGVGIEAAKNLSMAGVHSIVLCDPKRVEPKDMGVNFAITEAAIKASLTRAEASQRLVAELNPNVRVRVVETLTEEIVSNMNAVVYTSAAPDCSMKTLTRWNDFCRSRKPAISFIFAFQGGVLGSVFVDHGNHFTVKDPDGRPMIQKSILEVVNKKDKTGASYTRIRFETPEGQTPGALRDYTKIRFSEVKGLCKKNGESVNGHVFDGVVCTGDPRDTVRIYPSFESQGYSAYETAGFLHELKEVTELQFRPLKEALTLPGSFVPVSPMMDGSEESQSHLCLMALLHFVEKHKRLPLLHNEKEASEVLSIAKTLNAENAKEKMKYNEEDFNVLLPPEKEEFPHRLAPPPKPFHFTVDSIDETFIHTQSLISQAELQPLSAVFGAVVAQEIVKITGRYTPIYQWFHFNCATMLPNSTNYGNSNDYTPKNSRYDHLIAMLGKKFQEKLGNLHIFMVGCGALGCENIKNFALCGLACGEKGSLVVTDNDRIEVSNLSRQFLFREENVGQSKSVAAAGRMRMMNKDAKIDPRQDYVGPSMEHIYHDKFWNSLDVVVNALDNMETRLYVDDQCVKFKKILVEAGTMGTGGNVDIIVPGKTTSYSDGGAADASGGIPMCTLRNFPYIFDHCIEWARAQFDDFFVSPMQTVEQLLEDPNAFTERIKKEISAAQSAGERRSLVEKNLGSLHTIQKVLSVLSGGVDMNKCVQCAWEMMFLLFRDRIKDLQRSFPKNAKKKNGEDFWSGHRKYPTALEIDPKKVTSDPDIAEFLIATSNLFASMYGLHPIKHEPRFNDPNNRWMKQYRSLDWLNSVISKCTVPVYHPGTVENLDDDLLDTVEKTKAGQTEESKEEQLLNILTSVTKTAEKCRDRKMMALDFEKDDDDNFHIDFVTAASNLRAKNYDIPTQDRMKVKLVAGKIIPAISTTTSAVTGLALIEYFKTLQEKDISCLRNGMIDVGTNNYVLFERDAPIKNRTKIAISYLPEQDYTYKKKIIRVPDGFTKYDAIEIPINKKTTVLEFATSLEKKLNTLLPPNSSSCEVISIGVGKGMLWNGSRKHANTNRSLMEVIEQQKTAEAGGKLPCPFWQNRVQFCDLSVTVSLDEENMEVDEIDVETAMIRLRITQ
ncbi:putative ubiquitin-activating enzyme e1 [Trypanosoma theileri]|uniref:Ubiquitin-like 1-activating enzyme E1A n=1 Tax=Trypanosoma theileri TaxID=67003 RepID=A0A1X0P5N5_9TRYP|nr:putative ubiquitin-activating enzyme e1 [Trypanosoma theileri]ORC92158.1 putative ubiquitin-activating enzyme e1 [Trypanosoma theileri]